MLNDCSSAPEVAAPWIFSVHVLRGLSDEICKCFLVPAPSLTPKAQSLEAARGCFLFVCAVSKPRMQP